MNKASLPPGVLNVITSPSRELGEALIGHPDASRVALTGSTNTGRRVMEIVGPQFKRIMLELGGSDPVIVCPKINVDNVVRA